MSKLPLSYEAKLEEEWVEKPEWVTLEWTFWRRGRGVLAASGLGGLGLFFGPWVDVTAPEIVTVSGLEMAQILGWMWACPIAWLMLVATALSRRSVAKMRGARVAAALFCGLPLVTILVLSLTPPLGGLVPVRFQYGWAFHGTWLVGLVALPFALWFGGGLKDLPVRNGS